MYELAYEISDYLNQPLNCVWFFVWTCMWKVCDISTNKSSIKVCENVCEKVYEKDVKRITWFHTVFHLSFTCLSHSIISHACEKRCESVKRRENHLKTVWNKPAFHTLFHLVFTCLLLVVTMFTLLRQRRLRWLGHINRMEGGHIPKDILYGELASGKRTVGCLQQRFKGVCKHNMKAVDINTESWEDAAPDWSWWRSVLRKQFKSGEETVHLLDLCLSMLHQYGRASLFILPKC